MADGSETAVFGGGCFWCTEAVYKRLRGVKSVTPGYAGGNKASPTYEQVSAGNTGHAEVIKVEYDPKVISYNQLLDVFWHTHDPTTPNRQGNDVGSQYRSIILFTDPEQKQLAESSKAALEKSGEYKDPIVTEIKPLDKFYEAEDYHRDYFANNPDKAYCQLVITPKIEKFQKRYTEYLNEYGEFL